MNVSLAAANPWNEDQPFDYSVIWLGTRRCLEYTNRKITGDPQKNWQEYVYERYMAQASGEGKRCLVLGGGDADLAFRLARFGFRGTILVCDIAEKAMQRTEQKAVALGLSQIRCQVIDLSRDHPPGPFDFILAEGVLHHIEHLFPLLLHLENALTPDGILAAVEFEGPVRFQLPALQARWINAALAALPKVLRPIPAIGEEQMAPPSRDDLLRIHYVVPSEDSVTRNDPSEALSGPKLKRLLPELFDVVGRRGFGGTLLSYMAGHFPFERANTDPFVDQWLEVLIRLEETLIDTGILEDEFVFYVLRKKLRT